MICAEMEELPKMNKSEKAASEHATDLTPYAPRRGNSVYRNRHQGPAEDRTIVIQIRNREGYKIYHFGRFRYKQLV